MWRALTGPLRNGLQWWILFLLLCATADCLIWITSGTWANWWQALLCGVVASALTDVIIKHLQQ